MFKRGVGLLQSTKRTADAYVSEIPGLLPALAVLYTTLVVGTAVYMDAVSFPAESFPVEAPGVPVLAFIYVFSLLPLVTMRWGVPRPSYVVIWYVYFVVYVPCVAMIFLPFGYAAHRIPPILVVFGSMILLSLHDRWPYVTVSPGVGAIGQRFGATRRTVLWLVVLLASLGMLFVIHSYVGLRFEIHGLSEIYVARNRFSAQITSLSGLETRLVTYSIRWFYLVLMPTFLAVGIVYGDARSVVFGVTGLLVVYSLTGYKSALFLPVGLGFVWFCLEGDQRLFPVYTLAGLCSFVAGAVAAYAVAGLVRPLVLVRRFVLTPGVHLSYYFEYFRNKPLVLVSDRVFGRPFFEYPFDLSVPYLIGGHYFGDPTRSVNANLWARGFAAFDLAGIALFTLLFIGLLWLYDSASRGVDLRITGAMLTGYIITFENSDPIVAILTNGFAFLLVVAVLLPRPALSPRIPGS